MWTMRKAFSESPSFSAETASVVEQENISNCGREASASINHKNDG